MDYKNFDKVFFFTYSPPPMMGQQQGALGIDFDEINSEYDVVEIKQSNMDKENKIVVTIFARRRAV